MRTVMRHLLIAIALIAPAQSHSEGWSGVVSGMQSHYSDIPLNDALRTDGRFNEVGLGLIYETRNNWFAEVAWTRGGELRHQLLTGQDEEGEDIFETHRGRTQAARLSVGYRFRQNTYFSWRPSVGYMYRSFRNQAFPAYDIEAESVTENSAVLGISAEYLVIDHLAVALSFMALSSGERQQGINLIYHF